MILPNEQYYNTMAHASAALRQITSKKQPVDPRSFALWYTYATGQSGLLNDAIDAKLAQAGTLTAGDIEELHDTHIGPTRAPDKVDRLRTRIADEIEQVMAMIEAAGDSAGSYSANLSSASRRLDGVKDRDSVRAIVEDLVLSTREMAAANAKLQVQCQALWDEVAQLRRELDALRLESQTDPLTSLGNRRFFVTALERLMTDCRAADEPLSLLMADVDHFKQINDTFGHVVGDRVLRFISTTLKDAITGKDVACRYGGEEFVVILPKKALPPAIKMAEELRHTIMKCKLIRRSTGEGQGRVTASFGVATMHKTTSAQALIEAADMCLYAAKRSGRNCVIGETDEKLFATVAGTTLSTAAVPLPRR
jgi:diguanylate cyclase